MPVPDHLLQLRTLITRGGELQLSLAPAPIPGLGADDVLVELHAAPINPSDQSLLTGPADLSAATASGEGRGRTLIAPVAPPLLRSVQGRLDQSLPAGNEGAGVVVAAGAGPAAQALLGRTVSVVTGATYATHTTAGAADVLPLPEGVTAADGASWHVNPMTALSMVETMRAQGHTALVHTAAASNLGQMLNRVCLADGVPLVNIVRRPDQVELLRGLGAVHVLDSSADGFSDALVAALRETGATLAFDALYGGRMVNDILTAMEVVASAGAAYSRYGSDSLKQVYIYGALDLRPMELTRSLGLSWNVGGWLLTYFLRRAGPETVARLRARVASELTTTFASRYTRTIALHDMLDPETLRAFSRKATGEKVLVDPSLPGPQG